MIEHVELLKGSIEQLRRQNARWIGENVTENQLLQLHYAKRMTDLGAIALEEGRIKDVHYDLREAEHAFENCKNEPFVRRGKKELEDSRKGFNKAHGPKGQRATLYSEYEKFWKKTHGISPRLSKNVLDVETARHFKVSKKTIQRRRKEWEGKKK